MYIIYNVLTIFFGLVFSPIILFMFIIKPKLRAGFFEKIGFYQRINSKKPVLWFHVVSVGELNAIEELVKKLHQNYGQFNIVISNVTKTGHEIAVKKLSKIAYKIIYFPYDFIFSVKSSIKAVDPAVVIIAETEIWPNFSHEAF